MQSAVSSNWKRMERGEAAPPVHSAQINQCDGFFFVVVGRHQEPDWVRVGALSRGDAVPRVQGYKQIPALIEELEALNPSKAQVVKRRKVSQSGSRGSRLRCGTDTRRARRWTGRSGGSWSRSRGAEGRRQHKLTAVRSIHASATLYNATSLPQARSASGLL